MYLRRILLLIAMVGAFVGAAAQVRFTPFPDASSSYWRNKIPHAMRADYIRLGRENVSQPWERIPDNVFAEFRTTGNRTNYEDKCFAVRRRLVCLVMAEIMEHRGRFMPSIVKGLHYFLDDEPWWGLPAHYPKAQPDSALQVVDLFNAETSSMLAWTVYMLGDEINRTEAGLAGRVRGEIVRRFIRPTLNERQGWMQNANNWNTWITSNFLECSLLCLESGTRERGAALRTVEACLRLFLKGYPDDGGCEEGVGYWDRAGASFFESLWMLRAAEPSLVTTDHRYVLTTAEQEKVAAMGRFITTMHISDLSFVNFSDAQVHNVPNINILFPYGAWIGDNGMKEFAAYIAKKYDYFSKPSTLFLQSGNWPTLNRELMLLSMLPQLRDAKAEQPATRDAWLANSQVMVARNADWLVAAKGGTNGESHNHNDIGNFIVYHNSHPVVIDLGRDTYTSQTFSQRRFELMNNRSMYHNVPLVNGFEQHDGRQYRASDVGHTVNDTASTFTLDIAKAYPEEAGVDKWQRTITLNRKRDCVEIAEDFATGDGCNQVVLMCYGKPELRIPGRVALADGSVALVYDAGKAVVSWEKVSMSDGIMKTQWKDNVYRIVLTVSGNVALFDYRFEKMSKTADRQDKLSAYLMVYHKDQDHGLHMAISRDGYTWTALNNDKPVISGDTIAVQHGIRDPHIFRGPDGAFYLSMTDLHIYAQKEGKRSTEWERDGKLYGWGNNRGLVLMKSMDLIHWTRANIDFSKLPDQPDMKWSEVGCVWAPETVFDEESKQLMIHFTTRQGTGKNRIYYAYVNSDYNALTSQPRLLAEAPHQAYNIIDSDIIKVGDTYHLFYVSHEHGATPKHATAGRITGPYTFDEYYKDGEPQSHEAPSTWKRLGTDTYVVMFDNYHRKPMNFGFVETRDFFTYHPIGYFDEPNSPMKRTNFSEQKHGAVTYLTEKELRSLEKYWNK